MRKDQIEDVLLHGEESGFAALLAPDRIERVVAEMQTYSTERVHQTWDRAAETPRELAELTAWIERLRERLR